MRQPFVVPLRRIGVLLALAVLVAVGISCSKSGTPTAPLQSTSGGTRGAGGLSGGWSSGLPDIPSQAVITLNPGYSFGTFMAANNLELLSTLDLPEAGGGEFEAETYYLVHEIDDKALDPTKFEDPVVKSFSTHHRVWMPEDDRDGLSFDDGGGRRSATEYASQPAINQVHILQARLQTEGSGELIAIMDTGIEPTHALFTSAHAKIVQDKNYLVFPPVSGALESVRNDVDEDGDGDADDGIGHGTHVAGIVFTGARRATFRIFKVLDAEGRGTAFGLAKAAKAAADINVRVINLSLGLDANDVMLHHVLRHCADRGIAVVASAGNRNSSNPQYPAAYDECVYSVAAVNASDVKADFSNYGETIDVSSPGVDIISALPSAYGSGQYAVASGTSMAAPFITAATVLVHAKYAYMGISARDAAYHVMTITDDINPFNPGYQGRLGSGRVNYESTLNSNIFYAE